MSCSASGAPRTAAHKVSKMEPSAASKVKLGSWARAACANNSAAGEAIYDPFLGSGTTLIAAETAGRACYAVDIDPRYVDVAIQRWQNLTGKAAVLAGEDRVFGDVAATRGVALAA